MPVDFTKAVKDWMQGVLKQVDPKAKVSMKQPWEALKVLSKLELEKESIFGQIETGTKWDVPIVLGKGSVIRAPSRIMGPVIIGQNTIIGPYAFIRGPAIIGNNCVIGSTEVKQSILMDGVWASHYSYIGDSIVGPKCNLGAGAKLANFRFDEGTIKVAMSKDKKQSTGLHKLGAIMENNVKVGCNAVLNPGTYVSRNAKIFPGQVVSGFVE